VITFLEAIQAVENPGTYKLRSDPDQIMTRMNPH